VITKGVCACTILISEKKKFFGVKFPVRNFGVLGVGLEGSRTLGNVFLRGHFQSYK
jgi:hypothetical protein